MGLEFEKDDNHFLISPVGDILHYDDQKRINALFNSLKNAEKVSFNTEELQKWDSSLVAILFKLALVCQKNDIKIDWSGLPKNLQQLVQVRYKLSLLRLEWQNLLLPSKVHFLHQILPPPSPMN